MSNVDVLRYLQHMEYVSQQDICELFKTQVNVRFGVSHSENVCFVQSVFSRLISLHCCSGRNPLQTRQTYKFSVDDNLHRPECNTATRHVEICAGFWLFLNWKNTLTLIGISTSVALSTYTYWLQTIQQDPSSVKRHSGNVEISK